MHAIPKQKNWKSQVSENFGLAYSICPVNLSSKHRLSQIRFCQPACRDGENHLAIINLPAIFPSIWMKYMPGARPLTSSSTLRSKVVPINF